MSNILGCDLGGTKIAIARFDAQTLEQEDEKILPTHAEKRFDHVFADMIDIIAELRNEETHGIGIGVPGLVRQPEGTVLKMPNIPGSEEVALKKKLVDELGIPVAVDNDANCFALAEALHGAGKGKNTVIGITLGTGVGGGIVLNGKVFHGAHGFAAEIGHMLLQPGVPPFPTKDQRGDVEQFLSGSAMGKRCKNAESPKEYLEGTTCEFMHPDLFTELSWLCTNLTHLLDPDMIILGGSAGRALRPHLSEIEEELGNWLLLGTPQPVLAIAELTNAATLGAALLLRT